MTQEPQITSRTTPPFTVIIEKTELISRDSGSRSFSGTLGNGKPTHSFKIMANKTFPDSLKNRQDASFEDTGIVMLAVHQLKDDGTLGKMVVAWEKSAHPAEDSHESTELKTAMITDIFTKFRDYTEEKAQPVPVL